MMYEQEEKRKPRVSLIIGIVVGLLLVGGILYLVMIQGSGPPTAKVRALTSINLREGPGTNYPTVGGVSAETEVTAIGRNEDGSWLLVETEAGQVWMTGSSQYVDIDAQAVTKLPVVEVSPPSYDASNPQVSRLLNQIPLVVHHSDRATCASHAGLNNILPSVADGNVIGPHSGDFAFVGQGGNVLFEYSNGGLQLIRDNPIARFVGDQKYLSLETALTMFEEGQIVWTGSLGDWPARGVTGCDESAKPG
jgi:uncharacterized protein YraI